MGDAKTPLRALLIEDTEDDALLLLNELERGGYQLVHQRVDKPEELLRALEKDWDIIFSDYSMPWMNGFEALQLVRQQDVDTPLIFVSGTIGEDVAVEAMRAGAHDYIMKDNLKRLLPAVRRELRDAETRRERREAEERLLHLARHDVLTDLPNRFHLIELLDRAIADSRGPEDQVVVAYINLDRFKSINDSLGYAAGNLLLQEVARRLQLFVGEGGTVARLAADEFVLVLQGQRSREQVKAFLDDVIVALERPYVIHGYSFYLGASIGVSLYPEEGADAAGLLSNADIATSQAKDDGGSKVLFYNSEMATRLEERLVMDRSMRQALQDGHFFLVYQPVVELATGGIVGVEALVRWRRENGDTVRPDQFIPLAEETGFILPLGAWVMREACRQVQRWREANLRELRVAVNVSAWQFHQDNILERTREILAETGLHASCLAVELTESIFIRDADKTMQTLSELHRLGIKVSLDDFGTGYSSFAYLKHFKVDTLKIDRSFICGIPENPDDMAIVSAIIAMADKLGFNVVAEGVETREQYDFLREQGCGFVQGYFLGRPETAETLEARLREQSPTTEWSA